MAIPIHVIRYLKLIKGTPEGEEAISILGGSASSSKPASGSGGWRSGGGSRSPYWFKTILGLDPTKKGGFRIEGKFFNETKLHTLSPGTQLLFQFKDKEDKPLLCLAEYAPGRSTEVEFHNGTRKEFKDVKIALGAVFANYDDLYVHLELNGVPVLSHPVASTGT